MTDLRSAGARGAAALFAVLALAAAIVTSQFVFAFIGGIALFVLATSFGGAARLSSQLEQWTSSDVEVLVWGQPLPNAPGEQLTLTSVRAISAGLHLYLRAGAGTRRGHLKVAQPGDAIFRPEGLVIGSAKYVQWEGSRLQRSAVAPALTLRRRGV